MALVRGGSRRAQAAAATALGRWAPCLNNDHNQVAITRAGAIEPLVALLRGGSGRAQQEAAGVLANLASNAENRAAVARAGAIEPLVALVRGGDASAQEAAATALIPSIGSSSQFRPLASLSGEVLSFGLLML